MENLKSPTSSDKINGNFNNLNFDENFSNLSFNENFSDLNFDENFNESFNDENFNDLNLNKNYDLDFEKDKPNEKDNLNFYSDFKEQFNVIYKNLTKEKQLEFLCYLQKQSDEIAEKYGLSTLKIGGNA